MQELIIDDMLSAVLLTDFGLQMATRLLWSITATGNMTYVR